LSATKALNGSIATLNDASMIISIPAPTHNAGKNAVNKAAFGIRMSPIAAMIAPVKK